MTACEVAFRMRTITPRAGCWTGAAYQSPRFASCCAVAKGTRPNVIVPLTSTFPAIGGFTVTVTVEAALDAPRLSVTTREKVRVVALATVGAVNVGCEAVALLSVTAVPAVCDQS